QVLAWWLVPCIPCRNDPMRKEHHLVPFEHDPREPSLSEDEAISSALFHNWILLCIYFLGISALYRTRDYLLSHPTSLQYSPYACLYPLISPTTSATFLYSAPTTNPHSIHSLSTASATNSKQPAHRYQYPSPPLFPTQSCITRCRAGTQAGGIMPMYFNA